MKLIKKLGARTHTLGYRRSWGLFLCSYCKNTVERQLGNGRSNQSCGCIKNRLIAKSKIKHGDYGKRLYLIWNAMKQRCLNPKAFWYTHYGSRSISVCEEWLNYVPFRKWALSNGYGDNLQLHRTNNDGNYEPSNCRWVTQREHAKITKMKRRLRYESIGR